MQPRHIILAVVLTTCWGLNFVVIVVGLSDFPPLLLAALRFFLSAIPVLFLPRPKISWPLMIGTSFTLFLIQFSLLFPAMTVGMPAGLASIAAQVQVFITIGIAAIVLREYPSAHQVGGGAVALAGLVLVALTVGANGLTLAGLLLLLGSAASWSVGNVLLRRAGPIDMLAMISWLALIAAGPQFLISLAIEGPERIGAAFTGATWLTIGAVAYIAFVSTTFGYAAWGHLLRTYPAATAAPFALLVPVSGTISSYLILGERFGPLRLAGMALILVGLAIIVFAPRKPTTPDTGPLPAETG